MIRVLTVGVMAALLAIPVVGAEPDKKKADPDRLKGMKAAITDIEAGKLMLRWPPLPDSLEVIEYKAMLKEECGVESKVFDQPKWEPKEGGGYNDVMEAEIEYRFGKGTLDRLRNAAKEKK